MRVLEGFSGGAGGAAGSLGQRYIRANADRHSSAYHPIDLMSGWGRKKKKKAST